MKRFFLLFIALSVFLLQGQVSQAQARPKKTKVTFELDSMGVQLLRYLNGTFDDGSPMAVSPDPLKEELMAKVKDGNIHEMLANAAIFGLDLTTTPLAERIEGYYARLMAGPGSARRLLHEEA